MVIPKTNCGYFSNQSWGKYNTSTAFSTPMNNVLVNAIMLEVKRNIPSLKLMIGTIFFKNGLIEKREIFIDTSQNC
jgi:hypothetical protein